MACKALGLVYASGVNKMMYVSNSGCCYSRFISAMDSRDPISKGPQYIMS